MACNCMTYLMERGIVLNKLKTGNIRFSLGSSYAIMSRNGDQPIEMKLNTALYAVRHTRLPPLKTPTTILIIGR